MHGCPLIFRTLFGASQSAVVLRRSLDSVLRVPPSLQGERLMRVSDEIFDFEILAGC